MLTKAHFRSSALLLRILLLFTMILKIKSKPTLENCVRWWKNLNKVPARQLWRSLFFCLKMFSLKNIKEYSIWPFHALRDLGDLGNFEVLITKCQGSTDMTSLYYIALYKDSNSSFFRMCKIPVRIAVTNNDLLRHRSCKIVIQYLDLFVVKRPTVFEETNPILLSPTATIPQTLHFPSSTKSQPFAVFDRTRMQAVVDFGTAHVFETYLSVFCASLYDIGRFKASGYFIDSSTSNVSVVPAEVPIRVPSVFITVIDKRVWNVLFNLFFFFLSRTVNYVRYHIQIRCNILYTANKTGELANM